MQSTSNTEAGQAAKPIETDPEQLLKREIALKCAQTHPGHAYQIIQDAEAYLAFLNGIQVYVSSKVSG